MVSLRAKEDHKYRSQQLMELTANFFIRNYGSHL